MRNLTISARLWRLKVKFSARLRIFFWYKQRNWIIIVVVCPCAEPWNLFFNIKFRREYLVNLNKIQAKLSRGTVSLRVGELITQSRQDRSNFKFCNFKITVLCCTMWFYVVSPSLNETLLCDHSNEISWAFLESWAFSCSVGLMCSMPWI